jgi:hypothetical protein
VLPAKKQNRQVLVKPTTTTVNIHSPKSKNMKTLSLCFAMLFCFALNTSAQNVLEVGTGWQSTGATRELTWWPGIQGSRKDIPVFAGWRYIGQKRVYYSPTARMVYINCWSIGGAMNLMSAAVSPAGLGIYFTKPPEAYKPEDRAGKWFIGTNINAAFRFGVNMTPHKPKSDKVPNPEQYKETLQWRVDNQDSLGITLFDFEQHYPFGPYGYVALDLPVQIYFNTELKSGYGVGFFLESAVGIFEWSLDGKTYKSPYAYGWNFMMGASFTFSKKAKG